MEIATLNAEAMARVEARRYAARIKPTHFAKLAGVSRQAFWRAQNEPAKVSLEILGKLEAALDKIEGKAA